MLRQLLRTILVYYGFQSTCDEMCSSDDLVRSPWRGTTQTCLACGVDTAQGIDRKESDAALICIPRMILV